MITDKVELLDWLKSSAVEVTFTKIDGSHRTMKCTLNPSYMPPQMMKEDYQASQDYIEKNPDTCAVWSIDDKGWRSFRYESVIYTQMIPGYD